MTITSVEERQRIRQGFTKARQDQVRRQDTSPHRVYQLLRAGIRDGSITAADQLIEHQLTVSYNASRNSIRKALQLLAEQGLLSRERRSGTSVAHNLVPVAVSEIVPPAGPGTALAGRLQVVTLECARMEPSPALLQRLQCEPDQVILLEQVGLLDSEPLYFRTGYCVSALEPADHQARVDACSADLPPLPVAFARVFGAPYGDSSYSIEAAAAETRIAGLLGVKPLSPTLMRELILRDRSGRPRELSFTYFRSGRVAVAGTAVSAMPSEFAGVSVPDPLTTAG